MWPKRLQILACLWGFVLVLLFVWLHLVLGPTVVDEAPFKGASLDLTGRDKDHTAPHASPSTSKAPLGVETEEEEEEEEEKAPNSEDLGEDSAETSAPTPAPQSTSAFPMPDPDEEAYRHPLWLRCNPEPPVEPVLRENNAPRVPPRDGDVEVSSEVPDVLAGTDVRHMHGRLGYFSNGTCCRTFPMVLDKKQGDKDKMEAHKGFCFNTRVSESISVDRPQKDMRSSGCKRMVYPCTLPTASVVISFYNEHMVTLMRSVHSLLNHAPPYLLKEVILVDDASQMDPLRFSTKHFMRLQHELEEYVRALPKVKLVRLKERRGIMVARMEGAWRAQGDVLIFLDSHIEASPGWLEPLLAHIKKHPKSVALPSMDVILNENLKYETSPGVGPLSFTWTLGQHQYFRPQNDDPHDSPIIAGGHLAVNRNFFLYLGGLDLEMQIYGGEEMEAGFRTWMCGGSVKHIPCSHVGHIFRQGQYWHGQVFPVPADVILRNKHRVAEVWMDDYKDVFKLVSPLPPDTEVGSLEKRIELRKKLKCNSFSWYLNNVAKDVRQLNLHDPKWRVNLMNIMTSGCIDTLGVTENGKSLGVYPCHATPSSSSTQAVRMDTTTGYVHLLKTKGYCMARHGKKVTVALRQCADEAVMTRNGKWKFVPSAGMANVGKMQVGQECMAATSVVNPKSPFSLVMEPCNGAPGQLWTWND